MNAPTEPPSRWLISPQADLLFLVNAAWPLYLLILWLNHQGAMKTDLELYITAVVGTPHRWVTLPLVANDRDRILHRWPTLTATGTGTVLLFWGLWRWGQSISLMILVRYLWNLWHVAAQHTGIARVYQINAVPERRTSGEVERYALRFYMLYAFLRVGSIGTMFKEWQSLFSWAQRFTIAAGGLDYLVLLIPFGVAFRESLSYDRRLWSKYVYLASVCSNYAAMIVFCHLGLWTWALATTAANAVFHATEYFGFVSWSVGRRAEAPGAWFLPGLARQWPKTLLVFLYSMALASLFVAAKYTYFWVLANTLVSYLHYAYDGVIWKMPTIFAAKTTPRAA